MKDIRQTTTQRQIRHSEATARHTVTMSRFDDKRSMTQTILDALSQTGIRPTFAEPAVARRGRYTQWAGIAAAMVGLAAVVFVILRPTSDPVPVAGSPVAVLEVSRGPVSVLAGGSRGGASLSSRLALTAGESVEAGAVIETGAAAGRAAFRLAGGQSMRLDTDTRVRLSSSRGMVLERGAVYLESSGGADVEVRTTLGVVRDIGTQFEVRLLSEPGADASLRVRVREGAIALQRDGESHEAIVGEQLIAFSDGTLERGSSPTHGADWDWVLETAPAPDIAGRPLQHFLDWAAREGGWTVRYADPEVAELAEQVVLHGDVEGLTVGEASSMVLESSGLAYRLEEATFWVESITDLAAVR